MRFTLHPVPAPMISCVPVEAVPFISQIAERPSALAKSKSLVPLPLKSETGFGAGACEAFLDRLIYG